MASTKLPICEGCHERDDRIKRLEERMWAMESRVRTVESKLSIQLPLTAALVSESVPLLRSTVTVEPQQECAAVRPFANVDSVRLPFPINETPRSRSAVGQVGAISQSDLIDEILGDTVLVDIDQPIERVIDRSAALNSGGVETAPSINEIENQRRQAFVERCRSPSPTPSSNSGLDKVPRNNLCSGCDLECEVSCVDSPSKFWLRYRPNTAENIDVQLLDLLRRMSPYQRKLRNPQINQYCSAPYEDTYRRGRISQFYCIDTGESFSWILNIDYGTSTWIATDILCILPDVMFTYQWQAILCRLFGIAPRQKCWALEVTDKFRDFSQNDHLCVTCKNVDGPVRNCFTVDLFRKTLQEETPVQIVSAKDHLFSLFESILAETNTVPADRFSNEDYLSKPAPEMALSEMKQWQTTTNHLVLAAPYEPEEGENEQEETGPHPQTDFSAVATSADQVRDSHDENILYRSGRAGALIVKCRAICQTELQHMVDQNQMLNLSVKHVESPDAIYAVCVRADPARARADAQEFALFSRQLTKFYDDAANRVSFGSIPAEGVAYGAAKLMDEEDGEGYFRCRVASGRYEHRDRNVFMTTDIRQDLRFDVFFLDLGVEERNKPGMAIYYLDNKFGAYPQRVRRYSLFDTQPVLAFGMSPSRGWQRESIEALKHLMRYETPMKAMVMQDELERTGIVLISQDPATNQEIIVNSQLVKMGLAQTQTIFE